MLVVGYDMIFYSNHTRAAKNPRAAVKTSSKLQ